MEANQVEAKAKDEKVGQGYLVLKEMDLVDTHGHPFAAWIVVEGATAQEAADNEATEGVRYAQVPKRSWKPKTSKVDQVTKVTLS